MLGWKASRPKYCQLVTIANKQKRDDWCLERLAEHDNFDKMIFIDTVQLDNHGRLCFRKRGHPRKFKSKAKHPIKVYVWAGSSRKGATSIVICKGILTATHYTDILETGLKPFINKAFPNNNFIFSRIMIQSILVKYAKNYYVQNRIIWCKTPVEQTCQPKNIEMSDIALN